MACPSFDLPLVYRRTFLEFDLRPTAATRSRSVPPIYLTSGGSPSESEPPPEPQVVDDVSLALAEGRRQTLRETWQYFARNYADMTERLAKEKLDEKRNKKRIQLPHGGFAHLVRIMDYEETDLLLLFHAGILRESSTEDGIEIWCSDEQLRTLPSMGQFLEEADSIRSLCETSLFLMIPSESAAMLVCYHRNITFNTLRARVRAFCGLPATHPIIFERTSDSKVLSSTCNRRATLAKAGLLPGDQIRVRM